MTQGATLLLGVKKISGIFSHCFWYVSHLMVICLCVRAHAPFRFYATSVSGTCWTERPYERPSGHHAPRYLGQLQLLPTQSFVEPSNSWTIGYEWSRKFFLVTIIFSPHKTKLPLRLDLNVKGGHHFLESIHEEWVIFDSVTRFIYTR